MISDHLLHRENSLPRLTIGLILVSLLATPIMCIQVLFFPNHHQRGIDQATPIMCIQVPNHHQGGLIRVAFQMALLQLFSLESQGLPTYRSCQVESFNFCISFERFPQMQYNHHYISIYIQVSSNHLCISFDRRISSN